MTFGLLKRRIEEITGIKCEFDDNGLVLKYPDIIYYIGYENQCITLSNSKDNTKSYSTTYEGFIQLILKIVECKDGE